MTAQSRRTFLSRLGWVSLGFVAGGVVIVGISLITQRWLFNETGRYVDVGSIDFFETDHFLYLQEDVPAQVFWTPDGLQAVSAICTYEGCSIRPFESVGSGPATSSCACCGSQYQRNGVPISGPATRPLPFYELKLSPKNILQIDLAKTDVQDPYVLESGFGISNSMYFDANSKRMLAGPVQERVY